MTSNTTKPDSSQPAPERAAYLFDNWFDPIEAGLRDRVHEFLHAMFEGELDMALSRPRYARRGQGAAGATGHRLATATDRGRCWEASAKWGSPFRVPG